MKLRRLFRIGLFCTAFFAAQFAAADTAVTIVAHPDSPGVMISPDFCGLSYETGMLHQQRDKYFFSSEHTQLIALFQSLGVRSLRVGGNSADAPTVAIPNEQELDNLFAFAQAAKVHVIFNLRLKNTTDPSGDVRIVKYLMSHYKPLISCFTIGNEPNMYFKKYGDYKAQWDKFAAAILAAAPDAVFNGPSATPNKTAWAKDMSGDLATWGHLKFVTQHAYPGGNAREVKDPAGACAKLLAAKMDESYNGFYKAFVPAAEKAQLPYRLEEANSMFHGGAAGVSNSFASALWGLDFMHWWAAHGAEGINFHTGDHFTADPDQVPGGYDISYSTSDGLQTHPMGYALKMFSFSNEGKSVPVSVEPSGALNLTAYGVLAPDGDLVLTIINKESAAATANPQGAQVHFNLGTGFTVKQWVMLQSPGNDATLVSGETLGGGPISGDGSWTGHWTTAAAPAGDFTLNLPASTAVVVRFGRQ